MFSGRWVAACCCLNRGNLNVPAIADEAECRCDVPRWCHQSTDSFSSSTRHDSSRRLSMLK